MEFTLLFHFAIHLLTDALSLGNDARLSSLQRQSLSSQKQIVVRLRHGGKHRSLPSSLMQVTANSASARSGFVSSSRGPIPELLFGSLYVGLPPQEFQVAFDTGSGNLVLPSRQCLSLPCRSHHTYNSDMSAMSKDITRIDDLTAVVPQAGSRETVRLLVGAGHLVGQLKSDRVCLGSHEDLCAQTGIIDAVEMSEYPFTVLPYDGILGLGLQGVSLHKRFNLLGNLAEAKALELNRFGVWFAKEGDEEDSEITFGTTDESRMGSSTMFWKALPRPETGLWELDLTDVEVGKKRMNACGQSGCRVAFDTGTSVIGGPSDFIDILTSRLDVAGCNMDSLPMIGFVLNRTVLRLDPSDYLKREGARCYHQFMKIDVPPPKGPIILLGSPFFRRYYTVFDRVTLRLGFALSKHKGVGESSEATAARLVSQTGDDVSDAIDS